MGLCWVPQCLGQNQWIILQCARFREYSRPFLSWFEDLLWEKLNNQWEEAKEIDAKYRENQGDGAWPNLHSAPGNAFWIIVWSLSMAICWVPFAWFLFGLCRAPNHRSQTAGVWNRGAQIARNSPKSLGDEDQIARSESPRFVIRTSVHDAVRIVILNHTQITKPTRQFCTFFVACDSGMEVPHHTSRNWGSRPLPDPGPSEATGEWLLAIGSCGGRPHYKTGFRP